MGDEEILDDALRTCPAHRSALVRQRCGDDVDRFRRVLALVEAAGGTATRSGNPTQIATPYPIGARFGRYVITSLLGTGGMGTVYAAQDEELDRRVALKVLHVTADKDLGREARMLARVRHPNVVGVYDVGRHDGRHFISMEFVEGETLRRWIRPGRPWREVLRLLIPAARGLKAAHEAGVVHRDFKPENVLLSADTQRVLVGDFGIAGLCAVDGNAAPTPSASGTNPVTSASGGTPGYMAPEQILGRTADARTDVFAYCTVLHEALYGTRPSGKLVRGRKIPGWLRRAMLRGLDPDPKERWANMGALLAHLQLRLQVRRATKVGTAGLAIATVALGGAQLAESWSAARCEAKRPRMSEIWNTSAGNRLRAAFAASGRPFAVDAADRTIENLDAYAIAWQRRREQTCAAQGVARPEAADERVHACLDFAHLRAAALVDLLADANADVVARSVEASAVLPTPSLCGPEFVAFGALRSSESTNGEHIVHRMQHRLADSQAALSAGRPERALRSVQEFSAAPGGHAEVDLAIAGRLVAANALRELGRFSEASEELRAAFVAAEAAGTPHLALRAASQLTVVEGVQLANAKEGRFWSEVGSAIAERLTGRRDPAVGHLADDIGTFQIAQGDYPAALAAYSEAYDIAVRLSGRQHPNAIGSLRNIGVAYTRMGNLERALAVNTQALELRQQLLGPRHPSIGAYAGNLGSVLFELGEYRRAKEQFDRAVKIETDALGEDALSIAADLDYLSIIASRLRQRDRTRETRLRALQIRERTLGPEHPEVARSLHHIAVLDYEERDFEAALHGHQRAIEITEKAHGPDHPDIAGMLSGVGAALTALGQHDQALAIYDRAIAIVEGTLGRDHPNLAFLLHNRGVALQKLKQPQRAIETLSSALTIAENALGPEHPRLVELLRTLAVAHRRLGMFDAAVEVSERAVAVALAADVPAAVLARAEFTLAKALRNADADPRRAKELAILAQQLCESTAHEPLQREIEDWLNHRT